MIFNMVGVSGDTSRKFPEFTYSGTYQLINDEIDENGVQNWRLKLLSSGTLTFSKLGSGTEGVDVFLVGAGGGGASYEYQHGNPWTYPSAGGGGGYTTTYKNMVIEPGEYPIVIGAGGSPGGGTVYGGTGSRGGTTSAFGSSSIGGSGGKAAWIPGEDTTDGFDDYESKGGDGGSGGGYNNYNGGYNGGNSDGSKAGIGQGSTTREFGENLSNVYLYSDGGGATAREHSTSEGGGGGNARRNGIENSGGGGWSSSGSGGSGIVIIRNSRG